MSVHLNEEKVYILAGNFVKHINNFILYKGNHCWHKIDEYDLVSQIIFHSRPVFHTCMAYFSFYELVPSISAIKVLLTLHSSRFCMCFLRFFSSYIIPVHLELSTFTGLGNLFSHSFQMAKHIKFFYSVNSLSCYTVSYILFLSSAA